MRSHPLVPLILVATSALACATAGAAHREGRLRRELDAYQLPRPLAATWPDALRVLADRGVALAGKDRAVVGQPEASVVDEVVSKASATHDVGGGRWVADTDTFRPNLRYRVQGTDLGQGRSAVRYYLVQFKPDLGQEDASRDLDLELELVRRLDPAAADRIAAAAR